LGTTLVSFPLAIVLIKSPSFWNFYVSFGMLAYVVALFFVFQYFYKKGELAQERKRHEQRPIPKITKESLAAFNEKMQVNN
jgi:phosphotransferase system  glucose/maltose/N-acetylglucosamine-specific IIC component